MVVCDLQIWHWSRTVILLLLRALPERQGKECENSKLSMLFPEKEISPFFKGGTGSAFGLFAEYS